MSTRLNFTMGLSRWRLLSTSVTLLSCRCFSISFCRIKRALAKSTSIGLGLYEDVFIVRYQRMRAEAQVKPLPKAAKQITSFSFIFPSAHASLSAMGIEAAVVLP